MGPYTHLTGTYIFGMEPLERGTYLGVRGIIKLEKPWYIVIHLSFCLFVFVYLKCILLFCFKNKNAHFNIDNTIYIDNTKYNIQMK